jgi:hypothetical protein
VDVIEFENFAKNFDSAGVLGSGGRVPYLAKNLVLGEAVPYQFFREAQLDFYASSSACTIDPFLAL